MDKTRIHHYTPEIKRSSAEWTAAGESRPMRPKAQQRVGKVMVSAFWNAHGILFIDYLEKGKTINSDYYMALLNWWSAEIKKERSHMQKKKVLQGKWFGSNEEGIAETEVYFESKDESFYKKRHWKVRKSVEMNVLRLKETMLMNKVEFPKKTVFVVVRPETYGVVCYVRETPNMIKVDVWSRHVRSKTCKSFVEYEPNSIGYVGIKQHYCKCLNGNRTDGCCSHVTAVIYYLSHIRYLSKIAKPAEILSSLCITQNIAAVIHDDIDIDWYAELKCGRTILHESLGMRKLFSKWVPRFC